MVSACNSTPFPILNPTFPDFEDAAEDDDLASGAAPIILNLAPAHCGVRLDKVLSQLLPQYSRSRLQQWIEAGCVSIDGRPARVVREIVA